MIAATQKAEARTGPMVAIANLSWDGATTAGDTLAEMQTLFLSLSFIVAFDWLKRLVVMASPLRGAAVAVYRHM